MLLLLLFLFICCGIVCCFVIIDGLIVCHLPYGPTASFSISGCVMRHDIPDVGTMSEASPHLVFHNFKTRLGQRASEGVGWEWVYRQGNGRGIGVGGLSHGNGVGHIWVGVGRRGTYIDERFVEEGEGKGKGSGEVGWEWAEETAMLGDLIIIIIFV